MQKKDLNGMVAFPRKEVYFEWKLATFEVIIHQHLKAQDGKNYTSFRLHRAEGFLSMTFPLSGHR